MTVGNEGLPAHDPRWSADLALTYYSDATPARHIYNLKAGIRVTDRVFPHRVLGQPPLKTGLTSGKKVDLAGMVKEYLAVYELDPVSLVPSREILEKYGLSQRMNFLISW